MIYDVGGQGEYLLIGTIGRARGLKGHVRVRPFTDDPGRFYDLEQAWLLEDGRYTPVAIAEADVNGEVVHIRIAGVEDRTGAENLNGKSLYIKWADAVEPPPGAHFIVDVIGCAVMDDTGVFLGKLTEILQPGATDVYVLHGGPKGEILFPALKSVILSTDTTAKKIIVDAKRFKEVAVLED
jgi:16S rRNA processing protein RimM